MATEELLVLLDAQTAKFDAKLKSTNDKLDGLTTKADKADSGLKKFGGAAKVAGTVILATAAAATALAGAVSAIVLSAASSRRELELLSAQAKTSTSDFQALSFATNKYGINAEQIADISKDIADKVGEFSAAGTGAFQDYADVMKLSKDEARAAAQEFEGLSSQEILGRMVSRMEDASVSGDKMTFVLESLGNDASRLIPLFKGNSEELLELKKRFNDVNDSLQITGTQAEALRDVSNTFTLMTSSIGNATTAISATLAPVMEGFFNDIIDVVPGATQTIIDFVNSFLDAENITSIAAVNKEIADGQERIALLTKLQENSIGRMAKSHDINLDKEKERLVELEAQLEVLTEQEKKLEDAKRIEGGTIGGTVGGDSGIGTGDEIQAIADRFKTEEELLGEKLMRELEIIGENEELKLELYREYAEALQEIKDEQAEKETESHELALENYEKFLSDEAKLASELQKENDEIIADEKKAEKDKKEFKIDQAQGFMYAASVLNSSFLGDNELLAKGLIVADTAAAVMKSLSIAPFDYANVAVLIATGLAQLSNVGGSSPSSSGGGGSSAPQQPQQQNFQPDMTSLQLSNQTESGGSTGQIRFATDSGDELMDTIAKMLNKGQQEGRFA